LQRVAGKDRDAFSKLYAATSAKLYGVVLRILGRRDIADEVLQDTYVRIWERAADFNASKGSCIAWMAAIARNRALDEVRKVMPRSIEDMPYGFEVPSGDQPALELLIEGEDGRLLNDCLQKLDPAKRELITQAYLGGLSRQELARRFAAPVSTIKTWIHRSLAQLKDCLGS
jgi:RNA polymerase sigma-70 factor (ECF subfamily)